MNLPAPRILLSIVVVMFAGCDTDTQGTPPDVPSTSNMPGESTSPVSAAEAAAPSDQVLPKKTAVAAPGKPGETGVVVKELDWDALVPADWNPNELTEEYDASGLPDDDPRAKALLEKIERLWAEAPVVESLDGQHVKLPGFLVPLEMDAKSINEFLLVPYYGACVHVPPPPVNQTVHVIAPSGKPFKGELFDTIWVTGKMKVGGYSSGMGDAGYSIRASKIEAYE